MKRSFLFIVVCIIMLGEACGMPAYSRKITIFINGQERYIRLYGDESYKRAESEEGYTIVQNDQQQWCYAQLGTDSLLQPTQWLFGHNTEGLGLFLKNTPKHLSGTNHKKRHVATNPSKAKVGQRRMLIILMGYQDLGFTKSKNDFEKLFNQKGYNDDQAQGSVKDYYLSVSYNQLQLESDIFGPYKTNHDMAYYGKNNGMANGQDANTYALFEEAINSVASDADLSLYDGDDDGFIDNVHIIFAGYGEEAGANSNAIWSHEATFYRPYEIQGMKIDRYSCAPELRGNSGRGISRIGPHCHEIGHALGAMDFYDTNYSTNGEFLGTGDWDVMASGSWNNDGITPADFNPYVKSYTFGWISPKLLPEGDITIHPSCNDKENYYILKSSEYGDYYLLENRSKDKWGNGLPGEGLLIFHIHSEIENAGNEINAMAPQMCYVVCASSKSPKPNSTPASYGNINTDGCPYPGRSQNKDFGQSSTPKSFYWNNETCGIEINDISMTNDGNIVLTNNSIGAAFEPIDMERIFFEDFEDDSNVSVVGIDGTEWRIVDNPENTMSIINRPVAYEGLRSLQLSAIDSKDAKIDSVEFSCRPSTTGRMRIKIYIASLHVRFNKPNVIKIGFRIKNNPNWQYVELLSSDNNRWRQSFVELPNDADSLFKIVGTVYGGSVLAIDNLEVEQTIDTEQTGVSIPSFRLIHDTSPSYYTLDGRRHARPHRGINIVKKDGRSIMMVY